MSTAIKLALRAQKRHLGSMAIYQPLAVATEAAGPQLLCKGLGLGSIWGAALTTHQQPPQSTRGYKVLQQRLPCSAADSLSHCSAVLRKIHQCLMQLFISTWQSPVCIRAAALAIPPAASNSRCYKVVHVLLISSDPETLLW